MAYSGVLPKIIKGNELIKAGKRLPKAVPQIPFMGTAANKIERANVARRLSPSMSKQKTFLTKDRSFSYMGNTANFELPYSYPYNPAPYTVNQLPGYASPAPNRPISPVYAPQSYPNYPPNPYPSPMSTAPSEPYITTPEVYAETEGRRRIDSGRGVYNSRLNTASEARKWTQTATSANRELRTNLRFLGMTPTRQKSDLQLLKDAAQSKRLTKYLGNE